MRNGATALRFAVHKEPDGTVTGYAIYRYHEDTFCPWNSGHYRLQADGDSVTCERTQASADLHLTAAELGAIFLGGTTLAQLSAAGLVKELRPGAVATCTVAFRGEREPFCPTGREFPAY